MRSLCYRAVCPLCSRVFQNEIIMEDYRHDKAVRQARKMLSLMGTSEENLREFDNLVEDFDLTVADVTGVEENPFFSNPQIE